MISYANKKGFRLKFLAPELIRFLNLRDSDVDDMSIASHINTTM